jgi:hypothetical protein
MKSEMNFITVVSLILAVGCLSDTSNPIPSGLPLAKKAASDPNVKTHIFDNAVVAGEKRTVTMTESGDGTPGNPIGIDIDWGDPKNSKAQ